MRERAVARSSTDEYVLVVLCDAKIIIRDADGEKERKREERICITQSIRKTYLAAICYASTSELTYFFYRRGSFGSIGCGAIS